VNDKEEYWMGMDLKDLESAGAFIEREVWDKFILKAGKSKIQIKPRDYTR
jgi:hypothetical protein